MGIIALIAATSLPSSHYYHITTSINDLPTYQKQIAELAQQDSDKSPPEEMSQMVGENVQGAHRGAR